MTLDALVMLGGGLVLFALLLVFWQQLQLRRLRREVARLQAQLDGLPAAAAPTATDFSTSLDAAERQQLQTSAAPVPRNSAEKYRYVGSLAEQGLDAAGIAAALQMPTAEVEQLLQLAKLKQPAAAK